MVVQAAWRAYAQRQAFCAARGQVVVLQALVRGKAARRRAGERRAAIQAVQVRRGWGHALLGRAGSISLQQNTVGQSSSKAGVPMLGSRSVLDSLACCLCLCGQIDTYRVALDEPDNKRCMHWIEVLP